MARDFANDCSKATIVWNIWPDHGPCSKIGNQLTKIQITSWTWRTNLPPKRRLTATYWKPKGNSIQRNIIFPSHATLNRKIPTSRKNNFSYSRNLPYISSNIERQRSLTSFIQCQSRLHLPFFPWIQKTQNQYPYKEVFDRKCFVGSCLTFSSTTFFCGWPLTKIPIKERPAAHQ